MVDTCTEGGTQQEAPPLGMFVFGGVRWTPVGPQEHQPPLRRSFRVHTKSTDAENEMGVTLTPLKRQIGALTGKATPGKETVRDSDTDCSSSSSSVVVRLPRGKGQSQKRRRGGRTVTLVGDRAQKAIVELGVGTKVTPAGETPKDEIFEVFCSHQHNPRQRNSRSGYIQVLCKNAPCGAYCYASSNQRDDWYVTLCNDSVVNKVCIAAQQVLQEGMVVYDGVWGW